MAKSVRGRSWAIPEPEAKERGHMLPLPTKFLQRGAGKMSFFCSAILIAFSREGEIQEIS